MIEIVLRGGFVGAVKRRLIWRSLDEPGLEYFTLRELSKGWQLNGVVIRLLRGVSLQASYRITCDAQWRTRAVYLSQKTGNKRRTLELTADSHQRWWKGDRELRSVRGCYDIDLTITPSTNMLPIRRLNLKIGQHQDVVAAWVSFPELSIQPLPQRYTKVREGSYRYESRQGAFSVNLEVDDLGLDMDYPGFWKCEGVE